MTAVLERREVSGRWSYPRGGTSTSVSGGSEAMLSSAAVIPFRQPSRAVAAEAAPASDATTSHIEQDRFTVTIDLLIEALEDAARLTFASPREQAEVGPDTVREGMTVLRMLPTDVDLPEPVIEPSGALSWLWDRAADGFLVLAVNGRGHVQRSALIDGEESWGTTELTGRFAPEELALLARFRVSHA